MIHSLKPSSNFAKVRNCTLAVSYKFQSRGSKHLFVYFVIIGVRKRITNYCWIDFSIYALRLSKN